MLMDSRAFNARGFPIIGIISALTTQTMNKGLSVIPINLDYLENNLHNVNRETLSAVKIGMLCNSDIANIVADFLETLENIPVVLDPVIRSTSGLELLKPDAVEILKQRIFPLVSVVCPNWDEAEKLTGIGIEDIYSAKYALKKLKVKYRNTNFILTGGHNHGAPIDIIADEHGILELPGKRVQGNFRGTGCAFSSLLCAELSTGKALRRAFLSTKEFLTHSLSQSESPYISFRP